MPYIPVNCTSCGGEIQLDDTKEFGFCMHCGTKVIFQEAIQKVELTNFPKIENLLKLAMSDFNAGKYLKSISYFNRVLELDADNWKAILYRAFSRLKLGADGEYQYSMRDNPSDSEALYYYYEVLPEIKEAFDLAEGSISEELVRTDFIKFIDKDISSFLAEYPPTMPCSREDSRFLINSLSLHLGFADGYEYCLTLLKKIPHSDKETIAFYNKILSSLAISSRHVLNEGENEAGNREIVGLRSTILNRFENYKNELLSLDPNAKIPEFYKEEVKKGFFNRFRNN